MHKIVFRVVTLALLLLLAVVGALSWRTMQNLPNSIVYFLEQQEDGFKLARAGRNIDSKGEERFLATIEELKKGPNQQEKAKGLITSLPNDFSVLVLELNGERIMVNLSTEFELTDDPQVMKARLCQLLYTVTQPKSVTSVELLIDNLPFYNSNIAITNPLSRQDLSFCNEIVD